MRFDYFYGNEAEQFTFYRIPKVLVTSQEFRKVSDSAKLLYGLMLDRMGLSVKNGWFDEQNRAYIYFKTDEIMELMCCATEKATRIVAELDSVKGIGLIERIKQGQGKPAKIYLKKFIASDSNYEHNSRVSEIEKQGFSETKIQTFENRNSCVSQSESQEFRKSKCNYNNINNTDINNTEFSNINHIYHSQTDFEQTDSERWIDRYNKNTEFIKEKISYQSLCVNHDKDVINEIVNIMAEVLTIDKDYYVIEGSKYPAILIQKRFQEVDYGMIESLLIHFDRRTDKIYNMKAYLITALFNAPSTATNQLNNTVINDMYG